MGFCEGICTFCETIKTVYQFCKDPLVFFTILITAIFLLAIYYRLCKCAPLSLSYTKTPLNDFIVENVPEFTKTYYPTPYLMGGNLQTIFYSIRRKMINSRFGISYDREIIRLADGGQMALDYPIFEEIDKNFTSKTPIIAIMAGLTGGRHDIYVASTMKDGAKKGFKTVLVNQRGLSNTPIIVFY